MLAFAGAGYLAQGMASVGDIKFVVSNATPKPVGVKETNNVQIQKTIDAQYSSNVQGHRSLSGNAQLDNNVSRRVASHSVRIEEEDEEATEGKVGVGVWTPVPVQVPACPAQDRVVMCKLILLYTHVHCLCTT
jgi:hypothetical protein